jgi:hypothetical protein
MKFIQVALVAAMHLVGANAQNETAVPVAAPVTFAPVAPPTQFPTGLPPTPFPTVDTMAGVVLGTAAPVAGTAAPVDGTAAPVAGTVAPVADTAAPVAGTVAPVSGSAAPVTAVPGGVGTSAPILAGTGAPGTTAPVAATMTSAPVAGTAAPFTGTGSPATAAPISEGATVAPGTEAPGTIAPVSPSTVAPGTVAPVAPVTSAPVSSGMTVAPVASVIAAPVCSELGQDPYEFFGNGSFIPCCDANAQCLADWNNNTVWYYRCVDNCPSSPDMPTPEIPDVCTASGLDPYQVNGNGTVIPCCNPSKQCLNRWDGDDRNYYICVNETEVSCPEPPKSFCTARDDDPFQFFGTGEENECCTGLYKCLDNWDGDDRYYYRCESCCENEVDSKCDGIDPSPKSPGKKGARSSEINALVAVPGEYGVFTTQKSLLTSGSVSVSMLGLAGVVALLLL